MSKRTFCLLLIVLAILIQIPLSEAKKDPHPECHQDEESFEQCRVTDVQYFFNPKSHKCEFIFNGICPDRPIEESQAEDLVGRIMSWFKRSPEKVKPTETNAENNLATQINSISQ